MTFENIVILDLEKLNYHFLDDFVKLRGINNIKKSELDQLVNKFGKDINRVKGFSYVYDIVSTEEEKKIQIESVEEEKKIRNLERRERDFQRNKNLVIDLRVFLSRNTIELPSREYIVGIISYYNSNKGYGFVSNKFGDSYYFTDRDSSLISNKEIGVLVFLNPGKETDKGFTAKNVWNLRRKHVKAKESRGSLRTFGREKPSRIQFFG